MMRKYRINRDSFSSQFWCVECKKLWWPFWIEVGKGLIHTKEEAQELCDILNAMYVKTAPEGAV